MEFSRTYDTSTDGGNIIALVIFESRSRCPLLLAGNLRRVKIHKAGITRGMEGAYDIQTPDATFNHEPGPI